MKGRMRKITGILLVFVLCIGTASQSGAVTIDEAEKKADQLESDKKKAEEENNALKKESEKQLKASEKAREKAQAKAEANSLSHYIVQVLQERRDRKNSKEDGEDE